MDRAKKWGQGYGSQGRIIFIVRSPGWSDSVQNTPSYKGNELRTHIYSRPTTNRLSETWPFGSVASIRYVTLLGCCPYLGRGKAALTGVMPVSSSQSSMRWWLRSRESSNIPTLRPVGVHTHSRGACNLPTERLECDLGRGSKGWMHEERAIRAMTCCDRSIRHADNDFVNESESRTQGQKL